MINQALRERMEAAGAAWMPFGPSVVERKGKPATEHEVAEDFGQYEAEYAAIRRTVGVMHWPWRRVIPLRGADAAGFLHALLTQDINGLRGGQSRQALLLDAKGLVQADLWVHRGDEETWIECDAFDALAVREALSAKLFAEDVDLGHAWPPEGAKPDADGPVRTCFALLGPAGRKLLDAVRDGDAPAEHPALTEHGVHQVLPVSTTDGAVPVTAYRCDDAGVPRLRLWLPSDRAAAVYDALLDAAGFVAEDPTADPEAFAARRREGLRGRPVGWSAYNTARVEAGTPLFHVDFGPTNLPAEAGLVDTHVSFTKGCYPGQEAVARMKNLGHPKKLLVSLMVEGEADVVPVAGTEVFDADKKHRGRVIGAVTSSAASPLRGGQGVALAMMRWGKHEAETKVQVAAEGRLVDATVRPLRPA